MGEPSKLAMELAGELCTGTLSPTLEGDIPTNILGAAITVDKHLEPLREEIERLKIHPIPEPCGEVMAYIAERVDQIENLRRTNEHANECIAELRAEIERLKADVMWLEMRRGEASEFFYSVSNAIDSVPTRFPSRPSKGREC